MKLCNKCGETKPVTEFHKNARAGDGLKCWCKDCGKLASAKWFAKNPERSKANAAKWRESNHKKHHADSAKWRAENPERAKENFAKWYAANPELNRIYSHNRRARERANGGRLSPGLAAKLFKLQRGKCACCNVSIADGNHLDHVIPVATGGPNEDWNMQLLCGPCNMSKGAKHPIDFMQQRGFLL